MLKRDTFGRYVFLKKLVVRFFGLLSYARFTKKNTPAISGAEIIKNLPEKNVLFIANHQTYFADGAFIMHVIQSALDGYFNTINWTSILKCPKTNFFFVAAEETIKSGFFTKILGYAGAISVKRTWREAGKEINRKVDANDADNIKKALSSGWVLTFPQGTTTAFAAGRKGTAHLIKNNNPVVVPIVINGFRRAFDKKGIFLKKKGGVLQLKIKTPLKYDPTQNVEVLLEQVMESIEQSENFEWKP